MPVYSKGKPTYHNWEKRAHWYLATSFWHFCNFSLNFWMLLSKSLPHCSTACMAAFLCKSFVGREIRRRLGMVAHDFLLFVKTNFVICFGMFFSGFFLYFFFVIFFVVFTEMAESRLVTSFLGNQNRWWLACCCVPKKDHYSRQVYVRTLSFCGWTLCLPFWVV